MRLIDRTYSRRQQSGRGRAPRDGDLTYSPCPPKILATEVNGVRIQRRLELDARPRDAAVVLCRERIAEGIEVDWQKRLGIDLDSAIVDAGDQAQPRLWHCGQVSAPAAAFARSSWAP
jgi:hypothetical protein